MALNQIDLYRFFNLYSGMYLIQIYDKIVPIDFENLDSLLMIRLYSYD